MFHSAKQGVEGFSGLKINGAVLYLHQYVLSEFTIQGLEFVIGLFKTVIRCFIAVNKGTPHDNAAVGSEGISEQIRAISMCPAIVLRSGLPFRIRLDQKTTKIRNIAVDLIYFLLPPLLYLRIKRVGGL